MARPLPSAPVPPRMPMTGRVALMGSGELHLRERQHAHARGLETLAHAARRQHCRGLVAVDAEAVDLALEVLAVSRDDLLVEHHADDTVLDLLSVVQDCALNLPRGKIA